MLFPTINEYEYEFVLHINSKLNALIFVHILSHVIPAKQWLIRLCSYIYITGAAIYCRGNCLIGLHMKTDRGGL